MKLSKPDHNMALQALLAYFHFVSIIALITTLALEIAFFRKVMTLEELKKLRAADLWYCISAVLVIISGILRIFVYGKGLGYYLNNHVFLAKMGFFVIAALISLYPTITFLKWRKLPENQSEWVLDLDLYKRIRLLMWIEIIILLLLPFSANLMARGIGFM